MVSAGRAAAVSTSRRQSQNSRVFVDEDLQSADACGTGSANSGTHVKNTNSTSSRNSGGGRNSMSKEQRASAIILHNLEAAQENARCPWFWKYQVQAARIYLDQTTQIAVAMLIGGNFLTNLVEGTIDPQKELYNGTFSVLETIFSLLFAFELGLNMYSCWFWEFWKSGWNVFDLIVVTIGLLVTFDVEMGPLRMLRMMRAFRVFRLFKRVPSLRRIMDSLFKAIPGVINAFGILVLVMCIYAILAVEFWGLYGQGGHFLNEDNKTISLTTARGQDYGHEYFGNFPKSMYTMFQVLTGDSWSEAIARPLMHTPDAFLNVATAFYFVSFVVINAIVLINVVVAVLLEKMVEDEEEDLDDGEEANPVAAVTSQNVSFEDSMRKFGSEEDFPVKASPAPVDLVPLVDVIQDVTNMKREMDDIKGQLKRLATLMAARGRCECPPGSSGQRSTPLPGEALRECAAVHAPGTEPPSLHTELPSCPAKETPVQEFLPLPTSPESESTAEGPQLPADLPQLPRLLCTPDSPSGSR